MSVESILEAMDGVLRALRTEMRRQAQRSGLGRLSFDWLLLQTVCHEPGVSLNELARRIGFPKSRVSGMAASLAAEGVLVKEPDPADRRLTRLHLTDEGRRRVERWHEAHHSVMDRAARSLTPEDIEHLVIGLRALRAALAGAPEGERAC